MLVLGISGGGDLPFNEAKILDITGIPHDSAAALVDDGKVVAAIEEERFNRIRNTGKAPINAIQHCLDSCGVKMSDIDKIVYPTTELELSVATVNNRIINEGFKEKTAREWIAKMISSSFGVNMPQNSICFVEHDLCHASGAYFLSGFDSSLILTINGSAYDRTAPPFGAGGYIVGAAEGALNILDNISITNSLGVYFVTIMGLLGCYRTDEYKVMELAQYGNPEKYRKIFKKTYTLLPEGKYVINLMYCEMFYSFVKPRRDGESFTQEHKDIAAALQEALAVIVLHILEHYRKTTGYTKLCLSGGVANNYLLNGKILGSGLFEEVFVQPASSNAGNALGGALYISKLLNPAAKFEKIHHVYWGTDIGDNDKVYSTINKWKKFVSFSKEEDIAKTTAKRIAEGFVIGWAQGRSEFGCCTLGNRSILANPKTNEIKTTVSKMLNENEDCVPLAPSILKEYSDEYFEVGKSKASLSYMNFTLRVKEGKREIFDAVAHPDSSTRVQVVSKLLNLKYWNLIDEFRRLTDIPFILSAPFNNGVEPVVNSEEDAIVCFLSTNIDYLVIGDYLIAKRDHVKVEYMDLMPVRPLNSELKKSIVYSEDGSTNLVYEIRLISEDKHTLRITKSLFDILKSCDGKKTLETLFSENKIKDHEKNEVMDKILEIWSLRLIILRPSDA